MAGLASDLGWLLLFRSVQRLGAAALVPVSLALLSRNYAGGLLLVGAIGLLVLTLLSMPRILAWLFLAGGTCLAVGFLYRQRRARHPMLALPLPRNRTFAGANGVTLLLYWALSGALYFLPFNLVQVQGYSTLEVLWPDSVTLPTARAEQMRISCLRKATASN